MTHDLDPAWSKDYIWEKVLRAIALALTAALVIVAVLKVFEGWKEQTMTDKDREDRISMLNLDQRRLLLRMFGLDKPTEDLLRERIAELEAMLGVLRYELERLPEDALGVGGDGVTHWWVCDALISQIDELLENDDEQKQSRHV